jgi:arylsulfatase A-like enzyme
MNRREFLQRSAAGATAWAGPQRVRRTRHLILIVNGGGVRKKDYYEDALMAPNIRRLADEGFVFEEDHCERITTHQAALAELLQGRECTKDAHRRYPSVLDYVGKGIQTQSIRSILALMQAYMPRILVCYDGLHDVGHHGYEKYVTAVKATDAAVGQVFDWIRHHPYYCDNTAIVIRPEFGRDDEVNANGDLHHSCGFYYTHRVASIFWGPDFNRGVDRKTVIDRTDLAPTLAKTFGVDAVYAQGRVVPGLLRGSLLA